MEVAKEKTKQLEYQWKIDSVASLGATPLDI